ncbi:hypothetical protein CTAYLR_000820 [Chrysophaeum taylorii]|uniref:Uncharacterized protein n=1 Tax=Chrysophaeum taylorii TaxID=2483200 RepID=A0AAD7UPH1_9STRA|nr:hypothetical protein CTAYLR_000820 [Chrysophaeum taylorii]
MSRHKRKAAASSEDEDEVECWTASYLPVASGEKRQRRWSSQPNAQVRPRIERALSQRLYLLEKEDLGAEERLFRVLGSTGNAYDVRISRSPSCSCPDAQKGNLCKHQIFVMVRVLKCDRDAPIVHQRALLGVELKSLFHRFDQRRWQPPEVNEATKQAYLEATGRSPRKPGDSKVKVQPDDDNSGECSICFEDIGGAALVRCEVQCRKALHQACFDQWARVAANLTCPNCRAPWPSRGTSQVDSSGVATLEGYLNFAAPQGLSTVRDTSTYADFHDYPRYHHRSSYRRRYRETLPI